MASGLKSGDARSIDSDPYPRSVSSDISQLREELESHGLKGIDSDLLRDLVKDNVKEEVIEEELLRMADESNLLAISFQQKLIRFLLSKKVEGTFITLVIINFLLTFGVTILDLYIMEERVRDLDIAGMQVVDYAYDQCPDFADVVKNASTLDETLYKYHKENPIIIKRSADEDQPVYKASSAQEPGYLDYTLPLYTLEYILVRVRDVIRVIKMIILGAFAIEMSLKIIGYGTRYFEKQTEIFDGVVVVSCFTINFVITEEMQFYKLAVAIVIMFLMWRAVRIIAVMMSATLNKAKFRLRVLRRTFKEQQQVTKASRAAYCEIKEEYRRLKKLVREYKKTSETGTESYKKKPLTRSATTYSLWSGKVNDRGALNPFKHSKSQEFANPQNSRRKVFRQSSTRSFCRSVSNPSTLASAQSVPLSTLGLPQLGPKVSGSSLDSIKQRCSRTPSVYTLETTVDHREVHSDCESVFTEC